MSSRGQQPSAAPAPSFWTTSEAYQRAETLMRGDGNTSGQSIRDAVELLLQNEVVVDGGGGGGGGGNHSSKAANVNVSQRKGQIDAGKLLQRGLSSLAKAPHEALGTLKLLTIRDRHCMFDNNFGKKKKK